MAKRATASVNGSGTKRRGRPPKSAEAQPASPAPTTMAMSVAERWEKHFPGIKAARVELDKVQAEQKKIVTAANGSYRNLLKAFKKDGGNTDMLIEILNDQLRDVDEVERDLRDYNAYARLAGLPVGTQLGLFPDGSSIASEVDLDRLDEEDDATDLRTDATRIAKAKTEGFDAGSEGKSPSTCPYEDGSPEFLAWNGAWGDAQKKIAAKFGAPAAAGAEAVTA